MTIVQAIPALPVRAIGAAAGFYRDKLGFDVDYQESGFARLHRDAVILHLWEAGDEAWKTCIVSQDASPVVSGAESFLSGTASCRIEVHDVEALYSEYKAAGVLYGEDPKVQTESRGDRDLDALDLDGNLLTFFEPATLSR